MTPPPSPPPPPPSARRAHAQSRTFALRAFALATAFAALGYLVGTAKLPCTFAWVLGIPCPSCGSGRAVRAALVGDFESVLRFNPLGILAALVFSAAMIGAVVTTFRDGSPRGFGAGRHARQLGLVALVVVTLEVLLWLLRFAGMLGGPVAV